MATPMLLMESDGRGYQQDHHLHRALSPSFETLCVAGCHSDDDAGELVSLSLRWGF